MTLGELRPELHPLVLDRVEVATLLGIVPRNATPDEIDKACRVIDRLTASGRLRALRIGKCNKWSMSEVAAFVEREVASQPEVIGPRAGAGGDA